MHGGKNWRVVYTSAHSGDDSADCSCRELPLARQQTHYETTSTKQRENKNPNIDLLDHEFSIYFFLCTGPTFTQKFIETLTVRHLREKVLAKFPLRRPTVRHGNSKSIRVKAGVSSSVSGRTAMEASGRRPPFITVIRSAGNIYQTQPTYSTVCTVYWESGA